MPVLGLLTLNALLTSINIPAVGESTIKSREREVGPKIKEVAKESCVASLDQEKENWRQESTDKENVSIGVSYDIGWHVVSHGVACSQPSEFLIFNYWKKRGFKFILLHNSLNL